MLEGIAMGGPLDRVKLTASPVWNGLVRIPDRNAIKYHHGRYVWRSITEWDSTQRKLVEKFTWIWVA